MVVTINKNSNYAMENLLTKIKVYFDNKYSISTDFLNFFYAEILSHVDIIVALTKMNFTSVLCSDVNVQTLIDYNQPVILKVEDGANALSFYIVCYQYDIKKGFLIDDSHFNNAKPYYISKENLEKIWSEKKCIAFIANNIKKTSKK